jgi:hypothetical protein
VEAQEHTCWVNGVGTNKLAKVAVTSRVSTAMLSGDRRDAFEERLEE